MGSIVSAIYDEERKERFKDEQKWIKEISQKVSKITPNDIDEFETLKFLVKNRDKIMRNRRIIELLG